MAVKTAALLESLKKDEEEKIKTTQVEKGIDLNYDVGNLLATDSNPLNQTLLRTDQNSYLKSLARDNTQLLFNQIWKLETERMEDVIVAHLPDPETTLPREKPIPKAKPATKWEEYAKLKGVKNRKREKMIWDEASKSWKPRWGYKRGNDDTKEWVLEVPQNADPYEDQFEKRMKDKKERVAKNELQRLRNIARRSGKKVPGVGAKNIANDRQTTKELEASFHLAKQATASMGKFETELKNEKTLKNRGKKRKFDSLVIGGQTEKDRQMKILNDMYKKRPQVNVNKAVNQELRQTNTKQRKGGKMQGKKGSKKMAKGKGKKR